MLDKFRFKYKKGFTLIELIVVIAVLGILVLIGSPKLIGYVQKTELTRIQHDTKVMENKVAEVLNEDGSALFQWDDNAKDLGSLILKGQLYEKEGRASKVNKAHLIPSREIAVNGTDGVESQLLGIGGQSIPINKAVSTEDSNGDGYKIIPEILTKEIGTKLDGTFYSNELGKVYYEPNKPLKSIKNEQALACVTPESLDYEFSIKNGKGTITKYNGALTHLYIPGAFLLNIDGVEKCVPVQVIGSGAFRRGTFNKIEIPQSVVEINDGAFEDGQLTEVYIPHSVTIIGQNAFSGNPFKSGGVTIGSSAGSVNLGSGALGTTVPSYQTPTSSGLQIIVGTKVNSNGVKTGRIESYYGSDSTGSTSGGLSGSGSGSGSNGSSGSGSESGSTSGSWSSQGNSDNQNKVVTIPSEVIVNGETVKITEVAKGAYQGQGIIYVGFPESLEIIEDYAFAGNQLIGVTIPEKVRHIGNYAFAYNEIGGKRTLGYVRIPASNDYLNKINKVGNIELEGAKADKIGSANLLNHVFVFGDNFDIPEAYNPIENEAIEDDNNVYIMAKDSDFIGAKDGEFRYVGSEEYVEIPSIIKGIKVTSYNKMFSDYYGAKSSQIKGIKSTNKNVNNMEYMFYQSLATELDLSSFDTSKVNNMTSMFYGTQAEELDLSSFDTSNVKYMGGMFNKNQAESLDLSSFNTSNVTEMTGMFYDAQAKELNLSSFDTSKVGSMNGMFNMSQALILDLSSFNMSSVSNTHWMLFGVKTNTGYARTQSDANKLNNSSFKSSTLVFRVKPK